VVSNTTGATRAGSNPAPGTRSRPLLTDYTLDTQVSSELDDELTQRLIAYNKTHSPRWEENHDNRFSPADLHLAVRGSGGELIGGLIGRTHYLRSWLEIGILWVDEAHRGQGLGRRLMEEAESEGVRRGCFSSRLSTGAHQAPGFYEKLGYTLHGRLEDCPPGEVALYYHKILNVA
jgi:GNAT superfamily N-acetyltransferase